MIIGYLIGAFITGLTVTVAYLKSNVTGYEADVAPVVVLVAAALWPMVGLFGIWYGLAKLILRVTA